MNQYGFLLMVACFVVFLLWPLRYLVIGLELTVAVVYFIHSAFKSKSKGAN